MNKVHKIAIHRDGDHVHYTNWGKVWEHYCRTNQVPYNIVNCYSPLILEELKNCNVLVWHFSHYSKRDMTFARPILYSAKDMGLKVFPDFNDCWHFDDKIAQDYFLRSIGCTIPASQIFYDYTDVLKWLDSAPFFPAVAKLRCGSGSQNVQLLKSREDVIEYAKKMFFGRGRSAVPSVFFKTKSNVLSAKSPSDFWGRAKRIPDFIDTFFKSKSLDREKGYLYIQELIDTDGYDLKIIVIGEKLSFIGRRSRNDDFRASGGGDLFFDKSFVTQEIIDLCYSITERIGSSCMGYDVVVDKNTNAPYIIEMSYGFSHAALLGAKGYWARDGAWVDEPLNAPEEILENLLK